MEDLIVDHHTDKAGHQSGTGCVGVIVYMYSAGLL